MSQRHRFRELLKHPQIWQAGRAPASQQKPLPTGFAELDQALSGGWPVGVLIELLVDSSGTGEFRLLMPALTALSRNTAQTPQWIMLIAPPYIPYAPALVRQGVDISRLQVVHCRRRTDVLWATEQALYSGTCAAVLAWSGASDDRALRRLQLAAEQGQSWLVLFRPGHFRRSQSPSTLRIDCRSAVSRGHVLRVDIFKNRGSRPRAVVIPS